MWKLIVGATVVACCSVLSAWPGDSKWLFGAEELLEGDFESYKDLDQIAVGKIDAKDIPAVLSRLEKMPNLVAIEFHDCDLSNLHAKSPTLTKVKSVLIVQGKISQGTIGWLALFPAGRVLGFGCDTRGLSFELGNFTWLTFDNCEVSRSAVVKLIEKMTQVTFKEVKLSDEK